MFMIYFDPLIMTPLTIMILPRIFGLDGIWITAVVLKQVEAEETTKSGIVLPGQAQEKPQQAEVVAVGPGGVVDGKEVKMEVAVGDKVIYSKYSGTEVKMDGTEYIIVKQNDILAIVK